MKSITVENIAGFTVNTGSDSVTAPNASGTSTVNSIPPSAIGLKYSAEIILNENMNRLKARMLNIAEAVCGSDTRQCNAVKGLMKDALNQAYFDSVRAIGRDIEARGLHDGCEHAPISTLRANSLDDILVD